MRRNRGRGYDRGSWSRVSYDGGDGGGGRRVRRDRGAGRARRAMPPAGPSMPTVVPREVRRHRHHLGFHGQNGRGRLGGGDRGLGKGTRGLGRGRRGGQREDGVRRGARIAAGRLHPMLAAEADEEGGNDRRHQPECCEWNQNPAPDGLGPGVLRMPLVPLFRRRRAPPGRFCMCWSIRNFRVLLVKAHTCCDPPP
jgi:hypothetical protein